MSVLFISLCGCVSSSETNIESAKFALDSGDWSSAIEKATAVLQEDPGNVQAALLLSSAYAGRAGIKVMTLAEIASDAVKRKELFSAMHAKLSEEQVNTDDLHLSIRSLTVFLSPQPSEIDQFYIDQKFESGLLLTIEAFGLASLKAQPTADGPIDTSKITEDDRVITQEDLHECDNFLIDSGLTENDDLVKNVRYLYCILHENSGGVSGFTRDILRDYTLCQLTPNNETLSSANGDFTSSVITKCTDFDITACENAGPTEP